MNEGLIYGSMISVMQKTRNLQFNVTEFVKVWMN